jgi:hypothetical protein
MSADLIGPVEGPACPDCGMVPTVDWPHWTTDLHNPGCRRIGTQAQFGPPWAEEATP